MRPEKVCVFRSYDGNWHVAAPYRDVELCGRWETAMGRALWIARCERERVRERAEYHARPGRSRVLVVQ